MATNKGLRGRGSFNVGISFDGQWSKFNQLLNGSSVIMGMAAKEAQKKFAEEFRDKVKHNIRNGGKKFGYKPLGVKYLYMKIRRGAPSSLFMWSRTMLNSISINRNPSGTRFTVGILKGIKRPSYSGESPRGNRLQVHEYANILEKGSTSNNQPSRPIFSDTFRKDMGGKKGLKKFIELSLIKRFGIMGFNVTKL